MPSIAAVNFSALLGDAVNMAPRVQSNNAEGAVQCSAACAARLEAQGGRAAGLRLAQQDGAWCSRSAATWGPTAG